VGELSWEHFDPQDGVVIRVVYTSEHMADIWLVGRAAAAGSPSRFSVGESNAQKTIGESLGFWLTLAFVVGGSSLLFLGFVLGRWLSESRGRLVATGAVIGSVALCIWAFYPFFVVAGPPF
jgi:hypothetical protein